MDTLDRLLSSDLLQQQAKNAIPLDARKAPTNDLDPAITKPAFVGPSAGRKLSRAYVGVPNEVWPGALSTDPRFVAFKFELAQEATKTFPATIDSQGFAGNNGVTRDFSALASCSGLKMSPSNAPVVDRRRMLQAAKLQSGYSTPRHKRIAKLLHGLMFGSRKRAANFHFSKISSTSNPFFEYNTEWKKTMALHSLEHAETILTLVDKGDLHTLYRDHGWMFMATLVERHQAEGGTGLLTGDFVPKKRMVATREYALSGGTKGSMIEADKTGMLQWFGLPANRAAAMRVRTAYGFAAAPTYFISCLLAGVREQYYERFAFTWHHTTPEQIHAKIAGAKSIIGLDVTTMDQFFPAFLLDDHATWLGDYFDPRVTKLISLVNYAPYFAPSLGHGLPPFWAGNPFDLKSFKIDVGLSSGRADNPDLGKFYMTWVYLCFMDDTLGDLLEQGDDPVRSLMSVLQGKHPRFGLLDMSDDAVIALWDDGRAEELDAQLQARLKDGNASPYAVLAPEDGVAFLGNVFKKNDVGEIVRPTPNPVTYLVNRHCPEHGIRSPHRKYWGLGLNEATNHYLQAGSVIADLITMTKDVWKTHFKGEVPDPYVSAARHAVLMKSLPAETLSYADLDVLLNPAKRYYRYAEGDISDHVKALLSGTVEHEFIERFVGRYLPPIID